LSFILDALKKSDARRRRESAPNLHTPTPEPPRRRGGSVRWIVLIALLAGAAFAAYYLSGWRPFSPEKQPAVEGRQDAAEAASPSSASLRERSSDELADWNAVKPEEGRIHAPLPDSPPPAAGEQTDDAAESMPRHDRRRPRRRDTAGHDASTDDRRRRGQARERESAPVPAEEAMDELRRRVEEESDSDSTGGPLRQPEPAPEQAGGDQSATASSKEPEPRSVRRRAPQTGPASPGGVAEYVHAWELPLSVRRSIPELKLNIHVYAPEEERRFVLINGTRYGVGDSVEGAQIVAIRPEGAVMDFQSHRFLLEP